MNFRFNRQTMPASHTFFAQTNVEERQQQFFPELERVWKESPDDPPEMVTWPQVRNGRTVKTWTVSFSVQDDTLTVHTAA